MLARVAGWRSRLFLSDKAREAYMKTRVLLPGAGAAALAFVGLGAGAAVAFVANDSDPAQLREAAATQLRKAAHCMVAAVSPNLQDTAAVKAYEDGDVPLWKDLGSLTYPVSTTNAEAQAYFDQGLRLAANFNHAEARRAFRKAQHLDPNCALCFLGEALVVGPNNNVPMSPDANAPAVEALHKAQALVAGMTEKEKGLIEAVAKRYSDDPNAERAPL